MKVRVVSKKDYRKIGQDINRLESEIKGLDKKIVEIQRRLDTLYSIREELKEELAMLRIMKNLLGGGVIENNP